MPRAGAKPTSQLVRAGWDASEAVRRSGTQGVLRNFFDELFNHLDPYSRYAPPAEASDDRLHRAGRAGIGALVAHSGHDFMIQTWRRDGPAAAAAVHAGDRILAVDGQTTEGADPEFGQRPAGRAGGNAGDGVAARP